MRKENKRLNLNHDIDSSPSTPVEEEFEKLDLGTEDGEIHEKSKISDHTDGVENGDHNSEDAETKEEQETAKPELDLSSSDLDDEYGSREEVESRLLRGYPDPNHLAHSDSIAISDSDSVSQPKLGKAKAKRAKKAARAEAEAQISQENRCAACNDSFASKMKLFAHIKEEGHAQPVPKKGKGKKR